MRYVVGIYVIMNNDDKKVYVGGSENLSKSIKEILSGKMYKDNKSLQYDIEQLGLDKFTISFIKCDVESINYSVNECIKQFQENGYSIYNFIKPKRNRNYEKDKMYYMDKANNMSNNISGKIYINNGSIQKLIPSDEIDKYTSEGWKKGKLNNVKLWMNNGTESIRVDTFEISKYKDMGYKMGKIIER